MIVVPSRDGGDTLVLPEVQRGSILDRNGKILAVTTRMQRVSVWTPAIHDPAATSKALGEALGMDPNDVFAILRAHDGYAVVKRRITPEEADAIRRVQADSGLPGVRIEEGYSRFYPQGRLASHVVGYVGADSVPLDGIEYTFNNELAPQPVGTDSEPVYGDQVFLTIDTDIQYISDSAARAAMQEDKPDSITVLVMDARTGEILAYTCLPDFDPNEFQKESPQLDASSLMNRPVTVAYEPGSVFKIFTLSGLLDMGAITPTQRFNVAGFYERKLPSGETIRISDISSHGVVTPQQIIEFSINAGAAYASDGADNESFYRMLTRYGFGKQTGVPLQGETTGLLRPVNQWSARSKPTMAMGQEIGVSAMQVMAAATVLTNGGALLKPQIVKKIVSPQGVVVKEFSREPLWEVISPQSARTMLEWMETATLPAGTAHRAAIPGVRISAKTGTAQVASRETGTYSATDFIASMIGIFPTDDPRYVVYVVLQNPRGQSYYGSQVAAPIFREVAERLIDRAGILREGTRPATAVSAPAKGAAVSIGAVMPDLTGTPKKLLLPLLLRQDLAVTINGSGFVVRQTPPPGTKVTPGMAVTLELK